MEQSRIFYIEDGSREYKVKVVFHLHAQRRLSQKCYKCGLDNDNFIRYIDNIEIYDSRTSRRIRNINLAKRIIAKVHLMDLFKPICGPCLEKQIDDDLAEFVIRFEEEQSK